MPSAKEVEEIAGLHKELLSLREAARKAADGFQKTYLDIEKSTDFNLYANTRYWSALIHREALVKIANVVENDLRLVTTFSALTSARYLLEMLVWLRLIGKDEERFISYFIALQISEQIQHLRATLGQAERELAIYKKIAERQNVELTQLKERNRRNISRVLSKYNSSGSKFFLEYEHEAKQKGFAAVAKHLEVKIILQCKKDIAILEDEKIKSKVSRKEWLNEKWLWNKRAEEAGLKTEYEYIYGYVSRLVHCKPSSFLINQKNLEYVEIIMFHRFIIFTIRDVLRLSTLAQNQAKSRPIT